MSKFKGKEYQIFFHYKMYLVPDPGTTEVTRNGSLLELSSIAEECLQPWRHLDKPETI